MSDEAFEKWHKNFLADDYNWLPTAPDLTRAAWDEATRQAQAETVERCMGQVRKMFSSVPADIRDNVCAVLATLSPDPNFLARKMAEARLATLRDWPELCNGDTDVPLRHAKLCKYHREIARLERELAAMEEGT